jgi:hypothetical protein
MLFCVEHMFCLVICVLYYALCFAYWNISSRKKGQGYVRVKREENNEFGGDLAKIKVVNAHLHSRD